MTRPAVVEPHDAQARHLVCGGTGSTAMVTSASLSGASATVAKVHAVELIAGQDQHVAARVLLDVADVLAHGVGGALVPVGGLVGLLGGQDLDEAPAERVELVGVGDVPVQADAEKLRQHVDAVEAAVDAVADGDVDEPILAGDGHGRLAAQHGEGIQAGAAAAAQDQAQNITHDNPLWSGRRSTISGPSNTVFC